MKRRMREGKQWEGYKNRDERERKERRRRGEEKGREKKWRKCKILKNARERGRERDRVLGGRKQWSINSIKRYDTDLFLFLLLTLEGNRWASKPSVSPYTHSLERDREKERQSNEER